MRGHAREGGGSRRGGKDCGARGRSRARAAYLFGVDVVQFLLLELLLVQLELVLLARDLELERLDLLRLLDHGRLRRGELQVRALRELLLQLQLLLQEVQLVLRGQSLREQLPLVLGRRQLEYLLILEQSSREVSLIRKI